MYSDLIGIPFLNRGRDPKVGVDCWGLIMLAMDRYGVKVPDFKVSCFATPDIHAAFLLAVGGWKSAETMSEGTIVGMNMDPEMPDAVQHFGFATDTHTVLHTLKKMGSVNMRINHPFIKNKIRGFYEWIE
jgi:hypothetical protein